MARSLLVTVALVAMVLAATVSMAQVPAEADTAPLLFVSKTTSSDDIVLGSSVEIIVTVSNYGQSPAFDVVITDLLEDGEEKTMKVDSIPYGASETLRYYVTPKALGNYPVGVAHVTYNTEQGNEETQLRAVSNIIREADAHYRGEEVDDETFRGVVSVLTRERYDRLHARYIKEVIAYVFLGAISSLFPYVLYRQTQSRIDVLLRQAKRAK